MSVAAQKRYILENNVLKEVSGGFNRIHMGHVDYIFLGKSHGFHSVQRTKLKHNSKFSSVL